MICYHCFQEKGNSPVCPHCQFNEAEYKDRYPMALSAGILIGNAYTLGRVLGQGGFGITYIAKDNATGKRVAIKEYFPDSMATRTQSMTVTAHTGERGQGFEYGKQCFLDEAKTLASFIGNPNIVRVFRFFEENGTAYFVMEYIEGVSLKDYLRKQGGKISFAEAKKYLVPVMDALAAVHAKGIVHRDISPDNIIITKSGKVKLIDFGAARYSLGDMSRSLDVVLKHGYAPREQYSRHGRQGPFTDVYSLTATFYRAITGIIPQDSIDRMDEDLIITPRAYCPDLTPQGEFALFKGLAIQPSDRFRTMQELKDCMLSTGTVPPARFRPAPANLRQTPAVNPRSGSSSNRPPIPPAPRSGSSVNQPSIPPMPRSGTSANRPSIPPAPRSGVSANRPPVYPPKQTPAADAHRSVQPPVKPPVKPPVAAPMKQKSPKPFSPIKTMLISFGVSLAVFGAILLLIILLR